MLTRSDHTISDCLEVLDDIRPLGLAHIGFKDVGVSPDVLAELARRIKAAGATSYMEVVSMSREACLRSAQVARDMGIDRLLGGTQVEEVLEVLAGSAVRYLPFPGRPFEHPTKLAGSPAQVEDDCRRFQAIGCAGVDLLAYRATEADPLELVRARGAAPTASCWSPAASTRRRRSAISPPPAWTRSPSGPRYSTARSRRAWDLCGLS